MKTKIASIALGLALIPAAMAVQINGSIAFDGSTVVDAPLPSATAFNSFSGAKVSLGTQSGVYLGTGGTAATFTPFAFSGASGELWNFSLGATSYSFWIDSISSATSTALSPNLNLLSIAGTGMAKITGYEDTMGEFSFAITGNNSQTALGFSAFSFAAGKDTHTVPDYGTSFSLLAVGLIGLAGMSRKFRKVK